MANGHESRLQRVSASLTPVQVVLAWFAEARAYPTAEAYVCSLAGKPRSAYPLQHLPCEVEEAVRKALRGHPKDTVTDAARTAFGDTVFAFQLIYQQALDIELRTRQLRLEELLVIEGFRNLLMRQSLDATIDYVEFLLQGSRREPTKAQTQILALLADWRLHDPAAGEAGRFAGPGRYNTPPFLEAVEHWCLLIIGLLQQLYHFLGSADVISERYFGGHDLLFPGDRRYLEGMLQTVERLVPIHNHAIGDALDQEQDAVQRYTIDLVRLRERNERGWRIGCSGPSTVRGPRRWRRSATSWAGTTPWSAISNRTTV